MFWLFIALKINDFVVLEGYLLFAFTIDLNHSDLYLWILKILFTNLIYLHTNFDIYSTLLSVNK